jgi:hypothetical protein
MRALLLLCVTAGAIRADELSYEEVFDPFHPAIPLTGDRLRIKKGAFERAVAKAGLAALPRHMRKWEEAIASARERAVRDLSIYEEAGTEWWGFKRRYAESYRRKHGIDPAEAPIPPNNADFLAKELALKASRSLLFRERGFHEWVEQRAGEMLGGLGGPDRDKAVAAFAAGLRDRNPWQRVRCADVLGSIRDAKAAELLARAAATEKEPAVAAAMLRAYAAAAPEGVAETLAPYLGHAAWPVRAAAIRGLGLARAAATVDLLVGRFGQEEGRLQDDLAHALRSLTGQPLGGDGVAWRDWWAGAREGFAPPPAPAPPPFDPSQVNGVASDGPLSFLGVATRSERVVLCLDGRGASQWKEEAARCVESLPERGAFGIVVFGNRPKPWRKKIADASGPNRKAAADWLRRLEDEPRGDVLSGIEAALAMADGGKGAAPLADTLYLVARPPGETFLVHDPAHVTLEATARNRILGLRIHPIGPSSGGQSWWLQTLSRQNP